MKIKLAIWSILYSLTLSASDPKQIKYANSLWFSDFVKVDLNSKFAFYFDLSLRGSDWAEKWSQQIVRPGVTYKLNDRIGISIGIAYIRQYSGSVVRAEYRPWQQVYFSDNLGRIKIAHRVRTEQRFIQKVVDNKAINEYSYNNRYRYQLNVQIPLNKTQLTENTLYIGFSDEVMINSGREIVYNHFDQNRLSVGLGFKVSDKLNFFVSYTDIFLQKNKGNSFERTNVFALNVYHNFKVN